MNAKGRHWRGRAKWRSVRTLGMDGGIEGVAARVRMSVKGQK
jgi:hypothetical protein